MTSPHESARSLAGVRLAATLVVLCSASACGSSDAGSASDGPVSQTVEVTATEYAFAADSSTTILAGAVVQFRLLNAGSLVHELQVLDENGRLVDRVERLEPGTSGTVNIGFDDAGVYQFICDVDDHLSRGQRATFRVNDPVEE